jgi:hypothetical protein
MVRKLGDRRVMREIYGELRGHVWRTFLLAVAFVMFLLAKVAP